MKIRSFGSFATLAHAYARAGNFSKAQMQVVKSISLLGEWEKNKQEVQQCVELKQQFSNAMNRKSALDKNIKLIEEAENYLAGQIAQRKERST